MKSMLCGLPLVVSLLLGGWDLSALDTAPTPAGAAATAGSWPQFRGPASDGSAPHADPPLVWNETNHVAWKVPLTGRGRSSPILLGDFIWMTTAVEQGVVRTRIGADDMQTAEHVSLRAMCLRRDTGKVLWEKTLFDVPHPDPVHWLNSWATPTPIVESGRLYCDFGTFGTVCLDPASGQVLWTQQLRLDHQVGPGSSPALWRDRLFLIRDGRDAQYVAALDKKTGQTLWKTERPPLSASSPDLKKSFSTPLVLELENQVQLIAPGPQWAAAYDPLTGKEIWRIHHGQGFSIGTSPIYGHSLVYFGTGCFKPQLWAVRVDGHEDVTATHVVWKSPRQVPVMSSPVLAGDEIYWVSDDGMASCADGRTGEIHWQERLGGACLASPILAQGRLYFFRQDAKTIVLKAGKQFEQLAENALEGTLIATPAMSDRALYLRTDTHLYSVRQ
jgi:outer membrane protein assembly factor BamB